MSCLLCCCSNFCTGEVCALYSDGRLAKLLGGLKAITSGE
jgi:hypothetical protein